MNARQLLVRFVSMIFGNIFLVSLLLELLHFIILLVEDYGILGSSGNEPRPIPDNQGVMGLKTSDKDNQPASHVINYQVLKSLT